MKSAEETIFKIYNVKKMIFIERSKQFRESPRLFLKQNDKRDIRFLVLHHVQADNIKHAIDLFIQYEVSSHFIIAEDGKIFELVDENDIAYHAGVSYWRGVDGLNKTSIGIEFFNSSPFEKKFTEAQMEAGAELCKYLIDKYHIEAQNIVGHSDIGYSKETGLLNRKQDPSHLFDWKFLASHGVGIFPNHLEKVEKVSLKETKEMLKTFGYKVENLNDEFDEEMKGLAIVFNRRFLNKDSDEWSDYSQKMLSALLIK